MQEHYEHRRKRLEELLQALDAKQAWVARLVGVEGSYMSRILSEPGTDGHKNISDVTIRKFNAALPITPGWFDLPLGAELPSSIRVTKDGQLSATEALTPSREPVESRPPGKILHFSSTEALRIRGDMLHFWRGCLALSAKGRVSMLTMLDELLHETDEAKAGQHADGIARKLLPPPPSASAAEGPGNK